LLKAPGKVVAARTFIASSPRLAAIGDEFGVRVSQKGVTLHMPEFRGFEGGSFGQIDAGTPSGMRS